MFGALQNLKTAAFPVPLPTLTPGKKIPMPTPTPVLPVPTRAPGANLFDPFWKVWAEVHEQGTQVDDVTLMRASLDGMLAATGDKHTSGSRPLEAGERRNGQRIYRHRRVG